MLKEFTYDTFYGGISEDDSLTRQGEILYSENLDITSSSDYITVAPKLNSYLTVTSEVVSMYQVYSSGGINFMLFCDDNGNLYKANNSTPVLTGHIIYGFWTTSTYLYFINAQENIYRIALTNIGNSNWSTYIALTDSSIPTSSVSYYNIVATEDLTYISVGQNVYQVNNSTGAVVSANTFTISNPVVGLTMSGSVIKIFQESGQLILRDGTAGGSIETIELGVKIGLVKQIANIEYIFSSGGLYYLNGYQLQPISYSYYSDELNSEKIKFLYSRGPLSLTKYKGIFYGIDSGITNIKSADYTYGKDCIVSIGNKKQGMPLAFNKWINKTSASANFVIIFGLYVQSSGNDVGGGKLFISYLDSAGAYKIDYIDLDTGHFTISSDGIFVLPKFYGYNGEKKKLKSIKRIKFRADLGSGGNGKLEVFYVDKSSTGTNLLPLGADLASSTISGSGESDEWGIDVNKDVYDLDLAVRITSGGGFRSDTVKIYSVTIEYEPVKPQ